jgi:16S rRNA (guanine1516-N2)-methyltransferase
MHIVMTSLPRVAVTSTISDINLQAKAQALAAQLQLPYVQAANGLNLASNYEWLLLVTPLCLELKWLSEPKLKPLKVDFLSGKNAYRQMQLTRRSELIARAVGLKGTTNLTVLDTTAGLGRDAYVLASLGAEVLMLERSPIIAALLQDGLERLLGSEQGQSLKLKLINVDAFSYLASLQEKDYPDVIYLDPMYPERNKSALVKKEMRFLQQLIGDDADAAELLFLALKKARRRVVVKRPRLAAALASCPPDLFFAGQSSKFDVYLLPGPLV